jgi:hypothetical protein
MPVTPSVNSIQNTSKQQFRGFVFVFQQILLLLLFITITIICFTGCPDNSSLPPGPEYGLHADELDTLWAVDSRRYHNITIRVVPADDAINRQMRCQISGNGVSAHFGLYDDGGIAFHRDAIGFADSLSGDTYAEDGIYNRRVNSLFASDRGEYIFKFALSDGGLLDTLIVPVVIGEPEGLIVLEIDHIMILGSEELHRITVSVKPKEDAENREMSCLIRGGETIAEFQLYDDGGFGRWQDASDFADSISGDHLADNGVFTRRISSLFTYCDGGFDFTFSLSGDNPPDAVTKNINVVFWNPRPVIRSVDYPDSIKSGESELFFSTVVVDSNGQDDIVEVELACLESDQYISDYKTFPMSARNDTIWEWKCIPSIAAGLPTGDYPLYIKAADFYRKQNTEHVSSELTYVWFENLPPRVTDVFGPDTVWLPESGSKNFEYTIVVEDDQGLTDLDSLVLELWDQERVKYNGQYFDDGDSSDTQSDSIAGDGRYNAGFRVTYDKEPYITYTFIWTPYDRTSQRGETFTTSLVFMPYNGVQTKDERLGVSSNRKYYPLIK